MKETSREIAVAKLTVVITLAFILLNIPYVISNFNYGGLSGNFLYSFGFFITITIDRIFTGCNMLVNLITYSLLSTNLRETIKEMFSFKKLKPLSASVQSVSQLTENTSRSTIGECDTNIS